MKKLSFYFMVILSSYLIASCSTGTTESGINTDVLSVGTKFIDALHDKDTAKLDRLYADDFKGYGPSYGDSTSKAEALAKWANLFEVYDKIEVVQSSSAAGKVGEGPNAGDYVTTWALVKITYKNGRGPVNLAANYIFRVSDGKINLARAFVNEADTLRQLGYQITPPAAATTPPPATGK